MIKVHLTGPDSLALTNTDISLCLVTGILRQQLTFTTDHDGNISLDAELYAKARFRSSPSAMFKGSVDVKDGAVLKIVKMTPVHSIHNKHSHDDQSTSDAPTLVVSNKKPRTHETDRVENQPPADPAMHGINCLVNSFDADAQVIVDGLLLLNPTKAMDTRHT